MVEDELSAQRIHTDTGEPIDLRGRRRDHQRASTGLDGGDGGVADTIAATHRGSDGQLSRPDRPEIERGEGAGLTEYATVNRGDATVTNQDAARG